MNVTRFRLVASLCVGVLCLSCSSSKKAAGVPADANTAAPDADDAAFEDPTGPSSQDSGFPVLKDGGFALDDGTTSCDQLLAMVTMLQATAQACTPGTPGQCKSRASGTCCAVAVSGSADPGAIADYEQAVTTYVTMCSPKCLLPNCPPIQGACSGAGTCE
jgi:hypothetical protein